ncbi:MAG: FIST C-terminal domain-containing protein [Ardenticatenaceae bacterium]|nr:FIST C-terminal domain-containing protein [Ardenticatenaceae bacterium]
MADQMHFASAITIEDSIETATGDLAAQIRTQMSGQTLDLALAFLSPHFGRVATSVASGLREALSPRTLLGCTAEGVIGPEKEIERGPAIALVAGHLPDVDLVPFVLPVTDWTQTLDSPAAFRQAVVAPAATRLFVMLADPYSVPVEEVLGAFNSFYASVPVIGGMASGWPQPGGNALLLNDHVLSAGAVGVAFAGDVEVDVVVSQGCRPIGRTFTVSAARENVIVSLDGTPPLVRIQEVVAQLGEEDRALLKNGLLIGRAIDPHQETLGRGDFLIRSVMGVDPESGAIAVGDTIQDGEAVQFHLRDAVAAEEDLEMMLTPQLFFEPPRGAFLFSCNGRGTRLYDHPDGDVSLIRQVLGDVSLAGFFCAGEIGPIGGKNFLHGHTASLVLFRPQSRAH